ncbi:uncharacterized protein N7477_004248 [Penicillium maclennaniae]|uniref:uncharacterized protein n=1 Tax=Penicillium maclennaniae TaxID=1343394 RepID=UPI002540E0CB|nr:uncharacterized protein N7477_004248 [Penicillium maclennaniae]KAJ5674314.1 hypothetical protein N7477_004248 [Penicillium maclennaniae]
MPVFSKAPENRVIEACEAARAQEKPNLSKIAREFGVSYEVLRGRVRQGKQARTAQKPVNKVLQEDQEGALTQWLCNMRDRYLPVTPALLEQMANLALERAGLSRQSGKMWVYRFIKRIPADLQLAPLKQRTKEHKRIQADDSGVLELWYNRWRNVVKDAVPRLVYNVGECGF